MKSEKLLDAIGAINDKYVMEFAFVSNNSNGRIRKAGFILAACVSLLIVCLSVFFYLHKTHTLLPGITPDTSSVDSIPEEKLPITSIPNALLVDFKNCYVEPDQERDIYTSDEYVDVINNSLLLAVGNAKNVSSVIVPDGDYYWSISSFDVEVTNGVKFPDMSKTVRCITMCKYENYEPTVKCGISCVADKIFQKPFGAYVIENVSDYANILNTGTDSYVVTELDLTKYADYYVVARYDCTEDGFLYYGELIEFNRIDSNLK